MKPYLKYVGSKSWLVDTIEPYYTGQRLVEPFAGSLALSLKLNPGRALLNDKNKHVINIHKWVQKSGLRVNLHEFANKEGYYQIRDEFNRLISSKKHNTKKAAEMLYFLNKTSHKGLMRFNQGKKEFNVPWGYYEKPLIERNLTSYQERLKQWDFTSTDFEKMTLEKGDFCFADPPYHNNFTAYCDTPFKWEDQLRLASWLAEHNGPVIASNSYFPEVVSLYEKHGFTVKEINTVHKISAKKTSEMLAFKNIS
jgi:DNA adenine methylase